MLRLGSELRGTTTKHPGTIKIVGISQATYRVRFKGGQHNGKLETFLPRYVVEAHYEVIKQSARR